MISIMAIGDPANEIGSLFVDIYSIFLLE